MSEIRTEEYNHQGSADASPSHRKVKAAPVEVLTSLYDGVVPIAGVLTNELSSQLVMRVTLDIQSGKLQQTDIVGLYEYIKNYKNAGVKCFERAIKESEAAQKIISDLLNKIDDNDAEISTVFRLINPNLMSDVSDQVLTPSLCSTLLVEIRKQDPKMISLDTFEYTEPMVHLLLTDLKKNYGVDIAYSDMLKRSGRLSMGVLLDILRLVQTVEALELYEKGSSGKIFTYFGIMRFDRYEPTALLEQLHIVESGELETFIPVIRSPIDPNDALKRGFDSDEEYENLTGSKLIFMEASTPLGLLARIVRLRRKSQIGPKNGIIFHGHGPSILFSKGESVDISDLDSDLAKKYAGVITRIFANEKGEFPIYLNGCSFAQGHYYSTSEKKYVKQPQRLANMTGATVFASEYQNAGINSYGDGVTKSGFNIPRFEATHQSEPIDSGNEIVFEPEQAVAA